MRKWKAPSGVRVGRVVSVLMDVTALTLAALCAWMIAPTAGVGTAAVAVAVLQHRLFGGSSRPEQ